MMYKIIPIIFIFLISCTENNVQNESFDINSLNGKWEYSIGANNTFEINIEVTDTTYKMQSNDYKGFWNERVFTGKMLNDSSGSVIEHITVYVNSGMNRITGYTIDTDSYNNYYRNLFEANKIQ